jgi:ABC-type multidrug transport system ATPase subunit
VLRNINLEMAIGETLAVMGPNGSGKSTLLTCLAGAVRPVAGSIRWFGEGSARCHRVRKQIGFVGQQMGLYAELTVMENLVFAGRMHGIQNVHARVAHVLVDGGMAPLAHRLAGQLSQGTRQRIATLRALVHGPRLLVLDEPSASLDEEGQQWLRRLLERWHDAGQTVCFATHDATLCCTAADRIIRLHSGQIVATERSSCAMRAQKRSA